MNNTGLWVARFECVTAQNSKPHFAFVTVAAERVEVAIAEARKIMGAKPELKDVVLTEASAIPGGVWLPDSAGENGDNVTVFPCAIPPLPA